MEDWVILVCLWLFLPPPHFALLLVCVSFPHKSVLPINSFISVVSSLLLDGTSCGFSLFLRCEICVCVLSFAGVNMRIKPFLSQSRFNKCVVFRQTWSRPQPSVHPRSARGKPQGRGHVRGHDHYIITCT